jgi:hypothetical protein
MGHTALVEVLERASTDPAFRAQIQSDPKGALAGYDLTAEERAAIVAGDPEPLRALGVDARITKTIDTPVIPQGDNPFMPG